MDLEMEDVPDERPPTVILDVPAIHKPVMPSQLGNEAGRQAPAPSAEPVLQHEDESAISSKKKANRPRPPKPRRLQGKKLAIQLFSADTDEDREIAEAAFLEETADDEALYDYAMLVLQCLRSQENMDQPQQWQ